MLSGSVYKYLLIYLTPSCDIMQTGNGSNLSKPLFFFIIYFGNYMKKSPTPFQKINEIFTVVSKQRQL